MTHSSPNQHRPMQWIQLFEVALNELIVEQLQDVQQATLSRQTSAIERTNAAYERLNKFRRCAFFDEPWGDLTVEERNIIDDLVKVRMDSSGMGGIL